MEQKTYTCKTLIYLQHLEVQEEIVVLRTACCIRWGARLLLMQLINVQLMLLARLPAEKMLRLGMLTTTALNARWHHILGLLQFNMITGGLNKHLIAVKLVFKVIQKLL